MRVKIEEEYEGESLAVYLDSGEEIGRFVIVDDPKAERKDLEKMLQKVADEATGKVRR